MMLFYTKSILCHVELIFLKLGEDSCYIKANAHSVFFLNDLGFIWRQGYVLFNLSECCEKILCSYSMSLKVVMPNSYIWACRNLQLRSDFVLTVHLEENVIVKFSKAAEHILCW